MYKIYPANFYISVPLKELLYNLSPEFKAYLRTAFDIRIEQEESIKIEVGSDSIIFHFQGEK